MEIAMALDAETRTQGETSFTLADTETVMMFTAS